MSNDPDYKDESDDELENELWKEEIEVVVQKNQRRQS